MSEGLHDPDLMYKLSIVVSLCSSVAAPEIMIVSMIIMVRADI